MNEYTAGICVGHEWAAAYQETEIEPERGRDTYRCLTTNISAFQALSSFLPRCFFLNEIAQLSTAVYSPLSFFISPCLPVEYVGQGMTRVE